MFHVWLEVMKTGPEGLTMRVARGGVVDDLMRLFDQVESTSICTHADAGKCRDTLGLGLAVKGPDA